MVDARDLLGEMWLLCNPSLLQSIKHPTTVCAKWAKNYRIRIGKVSDETESNPSRVPALEASMRAYADKKAGVLKAG